LFLRYSASRCRLLHRRNFVHGFMELASRDNIVPQENV